MRTILAAIALLLCGCTTGTNGFVEIGPDTYMIGGLGKMSEASGSAVKARLYREAAEFCKSRGRVMVATESTSNDYKPGQYASAEIQFLCLPPDDPRAKGH